MRRGGGGASGQVDRARESQHPSSQDGLFHCSHLSSREAIDVEMYRLLSSLCCPPSCQESAENVYIRLKSELYCTLKESGCDHSSLLFLQAAYCLIQSFSSAPHLDAQLVSDVLGLLTVVCQHFSQDYQVATAILKILPAIGRHVTSVGSSVSKSQFINILKRFHSGVTDNLYGPPVEQAFFQCLANLSSVDPSVHWLLWDRGIVRFDEESNAKRPIVLDVLSGLKRPLNSTAIAVGQIVCNLFSDTMFKEDPTERCRWQERVLATMVALVVKEFDEVEERDVSVRRVAVLQALSCIAVRSPWMEKRILLTMLKLARVHHIEISVLKRALEMTCRLLNVDYVRLMECRLGFLMDQWLKEEQLNTFPYQLYCTQMTLFVRKYCAIIVPTILLKEPQTLSSVAKQLDVTVADLVSQHLVDTIAKILPQLVEWKKNPNCLGNQMNFAHNKYKEMEHMVGSQVMATSLKMHFPRLLMQLVFVTYDSNVAVLLFGPNVMLPAPGSFHYKRQSIVDSIQYFCADKIFDCSIKSFECIYSLLSTRPWDTHSIVLNIFTAYESGCCLGERQQALVSLLVLVEILTTGLDNDRKLQDVQNYVFHQLVHRLGRILRAEEEETLRRGALVILKTLLSAVIRYSPAFVANLLAVIVGYLTLLAKTDGGIQWLAVDILDFLIVDHQNELKDVIAQLSPFPNLPQFSRVSNAFNKIKLCHRKASLTEEIELFLKTVDLLGEDIPVESLHHLLKLLVDRKDEMKILYQQLANSSGSSGYCYYPNFDQFPV